MIPGPELHFLCPGCSNLIFCHSLTSGNTFGAKHYSDGKMVASMMPEFPNLTRCHKCGTFLWLSKAKKANYRAWKNDHRQDQDNGELAKFLTLYEYFEALQKQVFESDNEEIFIRLRILWGFNDRVRNNESRFAGEADEQLWFDNIHRLLSLIPTADDGYQALRAELNRYLGNFDVCELILGSIADPRLDTSKKQILGKCREKNKEVFLLLTE